MLAVFFFGATFAQNHNLTFQVDLGSATPSTNGVHVAGSFQNPAWTPNGTQMTQVGTSSIYSVTVQVPAGNYEFKFLNGNAWGDDESIPNECNVGGGNGNRWVSVWSDTTLPAVEFGDCAPAGMNSIMFMVDMSLQTSVDDTVSVAGSFQGWSPGTTIMADWNGDSVYRALGYVMDGDTVAFKYLNGAAWGTDESVPGACAVNNNRQVIASSNMIAGPVCFAACGPCSVPDTFDVTIQVDLQNLCDTVTAVDIAGPFNGWAGGDTLTLNTTTGLYETTLRFPGPSFKYKARYFTANGGPNWEGGADKEPMISSDTTLPARCFGADVYGPCSPKPAPADITFRVDFTQAAVSPATEIYLIGDFTQWQTNAIQMTPMASNPGVYEAVVTNYCPAEIFYKFVNGDVNTPSNEEGAGLATCGVPSGTGSYNRYFLRPDANPHTLQFVFDSCMAINIGIDENDLAKEVKISPNPFSTSATIELGDDNYSVTIMDITGRIVRQMNGVTGNVVVERGNMKAGIYMMTVVNDKGEARTSKFVVE